MITVFGSINLDLVVAVPRLPTAGETVSGRDHQTFPGGKGANQALAARRAGADVRFIGAVGQDSFAELALLNLREAGVDLSGVRTMAGSTGLALIGIDPAGENQIIVASGTNARVEASWLEGGIGPGQTLLVQGEVPLVEVTEGARLARDAAGTVIWNPAPVPEGDLSACLDVAGTVVVNVSEAAEIGGRLGIAGDTETFALKLAEGGRNVIVTLGADGVLAEVLGNFQNQALAVVFGFQGVQNLGQRIIELHVDDGADDLRHFAFCIGHVFRLRFVSYSASAPEMISISSLVMTA